MAIARGSINYDGHSDAQQKCDNRSFLPETQNVDQAARESSWNWKSQHQPERMGHHPLWDIQDVWLAISACMSPNDLCRFAAVCRKWRALACEFVNSKVEHFAASFECYK